MVPTPHMRFPVHSWWRFHKSHAIQGHFMPCQHASTNQLATVSWGSLVVDPCWHLGLPIKKTPCLAWNTLFGEGGRHLLKLRFCKNHRTNVFLLQDAPRIKVKCTETYPNFCRTWCYVFFTFPWQKNWWVISSRISLSLSYVTTWNLKMGPTSQRFHVTYLGWIQLLNMNIWTIQLCWKCLPKRILASGRLKNCFLGYQKKYIPHPTSSAPSGGESIESKPSYLISGFQQDASTINNLVFKSGQFIINP